MPTCLLCRLLSCRPESDDTADAAAFVSTAPVADDVDAETRSAGLGAAILTLCECQHTHNQQHRTHYVVVSSNYRAHHRQTALAHSS